MYGCVWEIGVHVWVCVGDRLLVCWGGGVSVGDRCVCVQVCVY